MGTLVALKVHASSTKAALLLASHWIFFVSQCIFPLVDQLQTWDTDGSYLLATDEDEDT